jgi:PAS domain-containing protein
MTVEQAIAALLAVIAAGTISFLALLGLSFLYRARAVDPGAVASLTTGDAVFVFDGAVLVDVTERAQSILSTAAQKVSDKPGLIALLAQRFPTLPDAVARLEPHDHRHLFSKDRTQIAALRRQGNRLRLTLAPVEGGDSAVEMDQATLIALESELNILRSTTDHMPFLVWRQNGDGQITWVNQAYVDACNIYGDPSGRGLWPPIRLFDIDAPELTASTSPASRRARLEGNDGALPAWFQFHVTPLDGDFLISAMNVDTVVKAEDSQRTFVQTLSKTFADLPVGLAVFTRDRRLALFNPSLADLTTIAPEKLILRPSIFGFFDMLRDLQMMPEPKDYATWRDQIVDLEASAADGTYRETWHLPFGRTFRVTGRPQVDGAVALLFEDISDEVGLSRRFRNEIETGQSVLDAIDDGLAVFAANGVLTMTNAAYDRLWSTDTREGLETLDINGAVQCWTQASVPNPGWDEARSLVLSDARSTQAWQMNAMLRDGRGMTCGFRRIAGGSTLARFVHMPAPPGLASSGAHLIAQKG